MPVQSTITNVDKQLVLNPRLYKSEGKNRGKERIVTRNATASYTMHFLDGAYMAINRVMIIQARTTTEYHHIIEFAGQDPPLGTEELIKYAISVFKANHHYHLTISDIYDFEGNVAYTQLVCCLMKLVLKFEKKKTQNYIIEMWIFHILYKFGVAPESPKAIRHAVLHGSYDMAYMEPEEGKEILDSRDNMLLCACIDQDYDIFFVRTNLHPSNFEKSLKPDREGLNFLLKNFKQKSEFVKCIDNYRKIRMADEDCTPLQKECDEAIEDYLNDKEDCPIIYGHESQQGGLLLFVPRGSFENERFLRKLVYKLTENCTDEITQVTFNHFKPGPPVQILGEEIKNPEEVAKVNKIVFQLKPTGVVAISDLTCSMNLIQGESEESSNNREGSSE